MLQRSPLKVQCALSEQATPLQPDSSQANTIHSGQAVQCVGSWKIASVHESPIPSGIGVDGKSSSREAACPITPVHSRETDTLQGGADRGGTHGEEADLEAFLQKSAVQAMHCWARCRRRHLMRQGATTKHASNQVTREGALLVHTIAESVCL
jgi:hypothetical protein